MRRWLPAAAYDQPVTVFMMVLALLVIGGIAWNRIPLQLMPSGFEETNLNVWVGYPNATPIETDEKVVTPLTAQLSTISGLQEVSSSARADGAYFRLSFHKGTNPDEVYNSVSDRLERAALEMPDRAEQGRIWKFDTDDAPIAFMGVTLPDDIDDPFYLLEKKIKPRLERQAGVATVNIWGVPRRSIYIDYDRDKILSHAVADLSGLQSQMGSDNFQMSGGRIDANNQVRLVRSLSRFDDIDTLKRYPVQDQLVLEDIADVSYKSARSASINRLNGQKAVVVAIKKESGANTIEVGANIKKAVEEIESDPRFSGVLFIPFFDQSEMVQESVDNLIQTALIGGVFAVIVLFAFLREWRMTLLISTSIPFSVLIAVGGMYYFGQTLNLLTLMGLMLAVGMVVDNAIVVVETIYRRRAEGDANREAAIAGSAEVNLAIIMSTATTMVVFLPLILMSGEDEISFFAGALGGPVIFAMLASLFVALIFAPLATRYITKASVKQDPKWLIWMRNRYRTVLEWGLNRRFDMSMTMIVLGIITIAIPVSQVNCQPVDENSMKEFSVVIRIHSQADYNERDVVVSEIEEILAEHKDAWGLNAYYAELDSDSSYGRVNVYLENDAPMTRKEVIKAFRPMLPNERPGVALSIGWAGSSGDSGNAVSFLIYGDDMAVLTELGDDAVRRIEGMPRILGARNSVVNEGRKELHVSLKRDALQQYGLSAQSVGGTVAYYLRGTELTPLQQGGEETAVITQFELDDRSDLNAVLNSPIFSPTTRSLVPLRSMADISFQDAPWEIGREDGVTAIEITVDLEKDMQRSAGIQIIAAALADLDFPRGYSWSAADALDRERSDQMAQLNLVLMSIVFVFLLMGVLFESWLLPAAVVSTIPMAVMGAFWLLFLTGTSFDAMAVLGLVILVGVVVNNGIVLVDSMQQLRQEGMSRREAIVTAGEHRFRPILMTAATTICGLIPMAMGNGEFVGLSYAPLGRTIIGGLLAATVLTLVVIPFLFAWLDDVRTTFRHLFTLSFGVK